MKHFPRPRFQPRLEALEQRSVPSVLQGVQVVNTLGNPNPAPVPGYEINDFEPDGINNNGEIIYGNDLGTTNDPSTFYGEGIFLQQSGGQPRALAYATEPAPGTATTYGTGFLGPATLNNNGDAAFDIFLNPSGSPNGVNAGAFRYSAATQTVTAVVVPGVTKVPGGAGTFVGTESPASLNNNGDFVFPGIVPTKKGIPGSTTNSGQEVGIGVYESSASGKLADLVAPGDKAPGGGKFDYAGDATINDKGDVAFDGHLAGEPYQLPFFPPQSAFIFPYKSLYVRDGTTGKITSIAHIGDAAPGGGTFSQCLFPDITNNGDVLFTGVLSGPSDPSQTSGVFLYQAATGKIIAIARPGEPMPGGGTLVSTSVIGSIYDLNNSGTVIFSGTLSTDVNHHGTLDTGEFEWSKGQVSLIARTGTTIPGVGTVRGIFPPAGLVFPPPPSITPFGGVLNDKGQILFNALFEDGSDHLLLYTPPSTVRAAATTVGVGLDSLTSGGPAPAIAVAGPAAATSVVQGNLTQSTTSVAAAPDTSTASADVLTWAPAKQATSALDAAFAASLDDPLGLNHG